MCRYPCLTLFLTVLLLSLCTGCSGAAPVESTPGPEREPTWLPPPSSLDITGIAPDNVAGQIYTVSAVRWSHFNTHLQPGPALRRIANPDPYQVLSNAVYMPEGVQQNERCILDLWVGPASHRPAPLVVYIHGGGFSGGNKSMSRALVADYLSRNYAVAAIDYRLTQSGTFPYPVPMWDSAWALKALRAYIVAAGLPVDITRIGATGGSAGAGIAEWIGYQPDLAGSALLAKLDPGETEASVAARSITMGVEVIPAQQVIDASTELSALVLINAQTFYAMDWLDQAYFSDYEHVALVNLYGLPQLVDIDTLREPDPDNPGQFRYLFSKIDAALSGHAGFPQVEAAQREASPLWHVTAATAIPTVSLHSAFDSDLTVVGTPPTGWGSPFAPADTGPDAERYIHNIRGSLILKKRFIELGQGSLITVYRNVSQP